MENFGEYITELRKKHEISLRELAKRLSIAPSYLHDIENSKRKAPSKELQDKLITELRLDNHETEKFYDLARKGKETPIAEDVKEIITSNEDIPLLCRRIARDKIDVKDLIKRLEEEKGKK